MFSSCKKEKTFVYDVNTVDIEQNVSDKSNVKSTYEFISIAYSDLMGKSISQADLVKLNTVYTSFGDNKLIEDMIIRNFLKLPGVAIPTETEMRNDVSKFVTDAYKKFLNRNPDEFEKYYMKNIIQADTSITPELLYYSMMTSNEYRYY